MKRVIGFAALFFAAGMLVNMIMPNFLVRLIIMFLCLLMGYALFYCEK